MAKEDISAKSLISLVSERPALWDKTSLAYKDREMRETSWSEICAYINENFNSLEPRAKEVFTRMIMKKWTHIRHSWVNSIRMKRSKPYIYHNDMKFMQKIIKPPRFNRNQETKKSETQNSNGTSNELENNEDEDTRSVDDITVENFKQEANSNNHESKVTVVNMADDVDDMEDWQFDDDDMIERPKNKPTQPLKKKRECIFVSSDNEEEEFEAIPTKFMPPTASPTVRPIERSRINYQRNNYSLHENRYWNFFMGILPSLDNLDEDHVLHFQSRVIVLIQNLRESQKQKSNKKSNQMCSYSVCKGRSRKRKFSFDDDHDHYRTRSRRSARQNYDPIASEDETEYSSNN